MKRRRPSVRVQLRPEAVWQHLARHNMTQNELARRVGIAPGYLSQLMCGKRSPSPRVRAALQAKLAIAEFDELFLLEEIDEG